MLRITVTIRLCSLPSGSITSFYPSAASWGRFSGSCGCEDIENLSNGGLSVAVSASRVVPCPHMSTAFYTALFMSVLFQWLRQKASQRYPHKDTMSSLKEIF